METGVSVPINLGIKKLKRELRELYPDMLRSKFNLIVKASKKRSWMEYRGQIRHRGHFPTHPMYGKKLNITGQMDEESPEYKVKVTNGKQQK